MENSYHMQHQIQMLQKDAELYKMAIDNLMSQKQKDHATILELNKTIEDKKNENKKLDDTYKDVITSLVDQIKDMEERLKVSKELEKSLKQTLKSFRGKSRLLNEQSYEIRRLRKWIKRTGELLDDVVVDAEDCVRV
ncbi:ORF033 [Spodoptera frugiperda granulovirus]|uniref:ORF033 n=1 Tax=Spodoptera frugiperda granulovirus TaxID=307454 RepID=A0A0C5AS21_9BBAC|nr:ORF033 [Spodoptera frugiperda granulovirus]AJK91694.1 ORF033 [Spodoptera frugiperda granulovirus]